MPPTAGNRDQQHDAGALPGEVSLAELGRDLRRCRWPLLAVFALFAGIGIAWAASYWMFPRFVYTTTVELASHEPDDRATYGLRLALPEDPATRLHPPGALRERLEHIQFGVSVLSPRLEPVPVQPARAARRALAAAAGRGRVEAEIPVDVSHPEGSAGLLLLLSRGAAADAGRIRVGHESYLAELARIQERALAALEAQIDQHVARLDAHAARQSEEQARLGERIDLTRQRLLELSAESETLQDRVRTLESSLGEPGAGDEVDGTLRARQYDELRIHQGRLAGLDQLIHVSLPVELDRLHGRALELERDRLETDLRRDDALGLRDTILAMEVTGLAVAVPEHGPRVPWIVLVSFLLLGLAAAVVVLLVARSGRGRGRGRSDRAERGLS